MSEEDQLLERWFRMYADRVFAFLLHRTDPQTAQDLVQDVFIVAIRKIGQVPEPPLGWLLGTARRLLSNKTRGLRRRDQLLVRIGQEAERSDDIERTETLLAFRELLQHLSPRDREVLTLSGWYGLTPAEAAEALGCSASTYAVRLHRARNRLTNHLATTGTPGDTPARHLQEALREL